MANPQAENGHVRIANEIIEELARINLSAYESCVLWCIWRRTWAWRKKSDFVSVSQIVTMTGLYKQHASRARLSLLRKRLLIEDKGKIRFNKDYEQWEVKRRKVTNRGDKLVTDSGYSVTDSGEKVTNLGDKSSPIEAPQKQKAINKSKEGADETYTFVLGNGKSWHLPQAKLGEYTQTFSDLDVERELHKAAQWLIDNPGRRKTAKGMPRFLGGWLGRAKPGLESGELPTHDASEEEIAELVREGILE